MPCSPFITRASNIGVPRTSTVFHFNSPKWQALNSLSFILSSGKPMALSMCAVSHTPSPHSHENAYIFSLLCIFSNPENRQFLMTALKHRPYPTNHSIHAEQAL